MPGSSDGEGPRKRSPSMMKSRSGRPVKAKKIDESETEDESEWQRNSHNRRRSPLASSGGKPQPAKRQRWVPHNPLILGKNEDESSKDIQISDDEESADDDGVSTSRRRTAGPSSGSKGASVPVRDESGRFAGTRPQTDQERRQAALVGTRGGTGGGIFKNAAVLVLREERKLMSTGEIARMAMKRGYIKVQGRTPEATMASAMYTDVKRKSDRSLFIRPHEGLFGLREWIDEGVDYLDPTESAPGRAGVTRSRLSEPTSSRPTSRTSNRMARKPRPDDPHLEEFTSRVRPGRGDATLDTAEPARQRSRDLTPRIAAGQSADEMDHTPFGDHRDGPPADLFVAGHEKSLRSGMSNIRKRSMSGPLSPSLPAQRTSSTNLLPSRRQRKTSLTMSPQDSGNLMMLLNAVEYESSGQLPKDLKLSDPRLTHAGVAHPRTESCYLTFGTKPMLSQASGAFARVGQLNNAHVPGGGELAEIPSLNLPPALGLASEEALMKLEASFDTKPLQISNSLSGPLPPAIQALNLPGSPNTIAFPSPQIRTSIPSNHPGTGIGATAGVENVGVGKGMQSSGVTRGIPSDHLARMSANSMALPSSAMLNTGGQIHNAAMALPVSSANPMAGLSLPNSSAPLHHPGGNPLAQQSQQKETGGTQPVTASRVVDPGNAQGFGQTAAGSSNTAAMSSAALKLSIPGSAFHVTGPPQMPRSQNTPDFGPPEEGVKRIPDVEAHVRTLERSLGLRHPKVGKGYLYLSRVYQLKATPEYYTKAQQALHHAYEICYAGTVTPKAAGFRA